VRHLAVSTARSTRHDRRLPQPGAMTRAQWGPPIGHVEQLNWVIQAARLPFVARSQAVRTFLARRRALARRPGGE
jgi:hypothetical protein